MISDKQHIRVMDGLVKVAASHLSSDVSRMQETVEKQSISLGNTLMAEALMAAAGNIREGARMMKQLLRVEGAKELVSEQVLMAASANHRIGHEVMRLLLQERGTEVVITEGVVQAAAGNTRSGEKVMKLLLEERGN